MTNEAACSSGPSADVVIPATSGAPEPPQVGPVTAPTCDLATGNVTLTGLPVTGTWTLTQNPGGTTTTGSGASTTVSGLAAGTYNYSITDAAGCSSILSEDVVIPEAPGAPVAPQVGPITAPTCDLTTGSVTLTGLPATGSWTLTQDPGGTTTTGTGTSTIISGLTAGTYTFSVTDVTNCSSGPSENVVIPAAPGAPVAPQVGPITAPTCDLATGSVTLIGLPATGSWTLTQNPGGTTTTGSGTSTIISGLSTGTYTYSIKDAAGCSSILSEDVVIPTAPGAPEPPQVGPVTAPTCDLATGSVTLTGLPATGTWTLTPKSGRGDHNGKWNINHRFRVSHRNIYL